MFWALGLIFRLHAAMIRATVKISLMKGPLTVDMGVPPVVWYSS